MRRCRFCSSELAVEWLKDNIVLAEQILVLADPIQQLALRESALSLPLGQRSRDTLSPRLGAV